MRQLGVQKTGLNRIQSAVIAFNVVIILSCLTVISQHLDPFYETRIVGRNCSGISASSEILPGIKAERRRTSHGACFHPAIVLARKILGSMRLTSIFNHDQAVLRSKVENLVHVSALAIEMHRDCSSDRPSTSTTNQAAQGIRSALSFQIPPQHGGIHVVRALVNVDEFRQSSRLRNRFCRGNKGVRYGDDDIAGPHTTRQESEAECIRTAADCDRMFGATESSECFLKFLHHRAADKSGSP